MENTITNLERLDFTMSIAGYCDHWGLWEAWRELESNARDTGAEYIIIKENNTLVFQDEGCGLILKDLILGCSESRQNENKIGQFGEGMKVAIMIYTRLGKRVVIESPHLYAINDIKVIAGIETFALLYSEREDLSLTGTKITVHDYDDDAVYSNNFITKNDSRIMSENSSGLILENTQLFVKGVYVKELVDYEFGYNINGLDMNRDRDSVSEWNIQTGVGNIWSKVEDVEAWNCFFSAVENNKLEKAVRLERWAMTEKVKIAIKEAFLQVFGRNSVIGTNEFASREAEHRGAKIVESSIFGGYMINVLKEIIATDDSFVKEKMGAKAYSVKLSSLTPEQKSILKILKKMAIKVGFQGEVLVAKLSELNGLYDTTNNVIKIDVDRLNYATEAKSTMIHELGHALYHTQDLTDQHVNACTMIGARLSSI